MTLEAKLLEDGTTPPVPSGQTLTLSLGSQSCTATVDASGTARCTLTFTGALGPQPLAATFAGDAYYLPSADTGKTAIVFAFPTHGAFVLADATAQGAGTTRVDWWGAQWSSRNTFSSGAAPAAFKGFAATIRDLPTTSPAGGCAGTWTTPPGNSSKPVDDVPSYMGVLVAGTATKSGSTISGTYARIVVVHTDPGYSDNPGHPGTGTIVAASASSRTEPRQDNLLHPRAGAKELSVLMLRPEGDGTPEAVRGGARALRHAVRGRDAARDTPAFGKQPSTRRSTSQARCARRQRRGAVGADLGSTRRRVRGRDRHGERQGDAGDLRRVDARGDARVRCRRQARRTLGERRPAGRSARRTLGPRCLRARAARTGRAADRLPPLLRRSGRRSGRGAEHVVRQALAAVPTIGRCVSAPAERA